MLEKGGGIKDLKFQIPFVLCEKPKITITIDFAYIKQGDFADYSDAVKKAGLHIPVNVQFYEDSKGVLTRDTRTKLAWLKEKYDVVVILS